MQRALWIVRGKVGKLWKSDENQSRVVCCEQRQRQRLAQRRAGSEGLFTTKDTKGHEGSKQRRTHPLITTPHNTRVEVESTCYSDEKRPPGVAASGTANVFRSGTRHQRSIGRCSGCHWRNESSSSQTAPREDEQLEQRRCRGRHRVPMQMQCHRHLHLRRRQRHRRSCALHRIVPAQTDEHRRRCRKPAVRT
jgi:hypothetical protein